MFNNEKLTHTGRVNTLWIWGTSVETKFLWILSDPFWGPKIHWVFPSFLIGNYVSMLLIWSSWI